MDLITARPEKKIDCVENWPGTRSLDDSQWLTDITSNLILALAFSISYFVEEPWIWIRLALIAAHSIAANLSISRCQVKAFIWAVLLVAVNVYRLVKTAFKHRASRLPRYVQDVYKEVFQAYNVSRPDFSVIIEKGKLQGIGPEESLCVEGHLRHDHVDLCILVSGKMTVWCDGLPLHAIHPGQFINSVEWASVLKLQEETFHDFGWEQQVQIRPDEDSVYLRIPGDHLEFLKSHKSRLWKLLEAIVCKDVTRKLYQMNDGFERMIKQKEAEKNKALVRLVVRSVSVDALNVNSEGHNISDNWMQVEDREHLLSCPHDSNGMPTEALGRCKSFSNILEIHRTGNASVAYLLRNSHSELIRDAEKYGTVVPSLRMQTLRINPLSCRFRDESIIRHYDWDQSWEHCGNCLVCKPLAEGEQVQHPTIKG